jgi:hypothetical protein
LYLLSGTIIETRVSDSLFHLVKGLLADYALFQEVTEKSVQPFIDPIT